MVQIRTPQEDSETLFAAISRYVLTRIPITITSTLGVERSLKRGDELPPLAAVFYRDAAVERTPHFYALFMGCDYAMRASKNRVCGAIQYRPSTNCIERFSRCKKR